jgi:hypothetical protein
MTIALDHLGRHAAAALSSVSGTKDAITSAAAVDFSRGTNLSISFHTSADVPSILTVPHRTAQPNLVAGRTFPTAGGAWRQEVVSCRRRGRRMSSTMEAIASSAGGWP